MLQKKNNPKNNPTREIQMYEDQKNLSDAVSIITLVSFPNTTFTLIEVLWFFFHLNFATVYLGVEQRI